MLKNQLTYRSRAEFCKSNLARKLLTLLDDKKTNLALSADVNSAEELIALAENLGSEICVLKTHIDILHDFTSNVTDKLKVLATQHEFLIFEDRKFADIGNTVKQQYGAGVYKIAEWAHIVNAHSLPGPGIIEGLYSAAEHHDRGLLLLAEMSSFGHLMDAQYQQKTLALAKQFDHFVIGFIAQHALTTDPHWIYFTPGVQFGKNKVWTPQSLPRGDGGDQLGQQYKTPEEAILHDGSDIIIVGRGIIHANNPKVEATLYRQKAWEAYQRRLS